MELVVIIPIVLVLMVLFFYLGWWFNSRVGKKSIVSAEERATLIIQDAQKEASNLKREKLLEVKDEWYRKKVEFDTEVNQKRQKLSNLEKQIQAREENSERKFDLVLKKEKENRKLEKDLQDLKPQLDQRALEVQKLEAEQNERLEKISGLSSEEAKKMLMENMVQQARQDASQSIKEIQDRAKLEAKKEAQKIIVQAIQRTAADHSIETTVSVVQIQNDEMKGRIIGKEGRNIRAFEAATGVDVIVDDTPEAVILSS
ncbi:MAG: Rnase Y domain-containing protein, partial [Ignavibacteriaceae bacterium]|nr:Rnase Y domain-containing protein [Ignavibacteriaceae bacterium]